MNKDKIRKLFNTPFDMCKYCAPRGITSKWEMCDKNSVNNIFEEAVRYTAGTLANKNFKVNDTTLSTTITKTI